jgi:hypothetical protein
MPSSNNHLLLPILQGKSSLISRLADRSEENQSSVALEYTFARAKGSKSVMLFFAAAESRAKCQVVAVKGCL